MRKYFKEYTEHLSVIVLLFYILGFTYQYFYYGYFEIEIQYYVTLTDVIFSAIGNLIVTVLSFLVVELILNFVSFCLMFINYRIRKLEKYNTKSKTIKNRYDRYVDFLKNTHLKYYTFGLYFPLFFVFIFLFDEPFYMFSLTFPAFIFRFSTVMKIGIAKVDRELKTVFYVILFVILLVFYGYWGFKEAVEVGSSYSTKVVKTEDIDTGDRVNKYIGETSSYFFIFDSKSKTTKILNKGNIDRIDVEENKFVKEERAKSEKELKLLLDQFRKELDQRKIDNKK